MLLLLVPSREQTGYRASRVEKHDGSGACSYESQTSQSRLHATPVPYFFLADQSRGFGPLQARNGLSCFLTSAVGYASQTHRPFEIAAPAELNSATLCERRAVDWPAALGGSFSPSLCVSTPSRSSSPAAARFNARGQKWEV